MPDRSWMGSLSLVFVMGVFFGQPAIAASSPAIQCGRPYTVAAGDTLFTIATKAYGNGWQYTRIFAANRDVMPSAAEVEVGEQLLIPCRDGSGPATRHEALAEGLIAPANPVAATPAAPPNGSTAAPAPADAAPPPAAIRLLETDGFGSFTGRGLPDGGMISDLVMASLATAGPERKAQLEFAAPQSLAATLLHDPSYDVAFPVFMPDCDRLARLTAERRRECAQFAFSRPFFQIPVAYFVRAGNPLRSATDPAALRGKRLCRPGSDSVFDLEQAGLTSSDTPLLRPDNVDACFVKLIRGQVDVVTIPRRDASDRIAELQLTDSITEARGLASVQTLYAIAARSNPQGLATLAKINDGLKDLMMSGAWFRIVVSHQGHLLAARD